MENKKVSVKRKKFLYAVFPKGLYDGQTLWGLLDSKEIREIVKEEKLALNIFKTKSFLNTLQFLMNTRDFSKEEIILSFNVYKRISKNFPILDNDELRTQFKNKLELAIKTEILL